MVVEVFGTLKDASFNSVNLSTLGFYCVDFIKPLMGRQERTLLNIPKISGQILMDKKFADNKLVIIGYIEGSSHDDLIVKINAIAAFLYNVEDKPLILSTEPTKHYHAQYDDYKEIETKSNVAVYELVFTCDDPFAYAVTPTTDHQDITVDDTIKVIANAGHQEAWPVITITFNAAQTHIYVENLVIPNNRMDISKIFNIGDILEIDCKKKTVRLNGFLSPSGMGVGGSALAKWPLFAVGNNEIITGTTDPTIDVDVDISYEKVYFY